MPGTAVIIVAAGRGHRFGAELPKQFLRVRGEPVLRHAVRAFTDHPRIDAVIPVIHPDDAELVADALEGLDYLQPVPGGRARQDSVRNGLEALSDMAPDLVLVHDAARPMVPDDLIDKMFDPFFTTKQAEGTGLGLSIVKELAELHRGSLELGESELGGLRARLRFPR